MLSVELPHGLKGASLIQHSTLNTQHSINHSTFKKNKDLWKEKTDLTTI